MSFAKRGRMVALVTSVICLSVAVAMFLWEKAQGMEVMSQLSTLSANMSTMHTIIESFRSDLGKYPSWHRVEPSVSDPSGSLVVGTYDAQALLAYVSHASNLPAGLPQDPFSPLPHSRFAFCVVDLPGNSRNGPTWFLWSPGPDGAYSIGVDNLATEAAESDENKGFPLGKRLRALFYDPTNGVRSGGDILSWGIVHTSSDVSEQTGPNL